MERLTKRVDGGVVFPNELLGTSLAPDNEYMHKLLTRLATYEDTELEPVELQKVVSRLDQLEQMVQSALGEAIQADKEKRLVILPCQIGAPVWWITLNWVEKTVTVRYTIESGKFRYAMLDWQNPVYTSQAAAEVALAKMAKEGTTSEKSDSY